MVIVTHESYDSVLVGNGKTERSSVIVGKPRVMQVVPESFFSLTMMIMKKRKTKIGKTARTGYIYLYRDRTRSDHVMVTANYLVTRS